MWVESELSKGSKFFFTITSQISQSSMEMTLSRMSPFHKRTILFVDTLHDTTGVVNRIEELKLKPYVVREVSEVASKERCPHIDTIVVDSLSVVCGIVCLLSAAHSHLPTDRMYTGIRAPAVYSDRSFGTLDAPFEP
jgi:hypothetical protein